MFGKNVPRYEDKYEIVQTQKLHELSQGKQAEYYGRQNHVSRLFGVKTNNMKLSFFTVHSMICPLQSFYFYLFFLVPAYWKENYLDLICQIHN